MAIDYQIIDQKNTQDNFQIHTDSFPFRCFLCVITSFITRLANPGTGPVKKRCYPFSHDSRNHPRAFADLQPAPFFIPAKACERGGDPNRETVRWYLRLRKSAISIAGSEEGADRKPAISILRSPGNKQGHTVKTSHFDCRR
jgi:hypothetical protein